MKIVFLLELRLAVVYMHFLRDKAFREIKSLQRLSQVCQNF